MTGLPGDQHLRVGKGATILREGDANTNAYFIISGQVEIFQEREGQRIRLARLGPGQIFGEMSLVLDTTRTATVEAIDDCVIQLISQETFNRLLYSDTNNALPLLRVLFERLRLLNAKYRLALESQGQAGHTDLVAAEPMSAPAAAPVRVPTLKTAATRGALILTGASPITEQLIGSTGVVIKKFPFRIGRQVEQSARNAFSFNDLYVPDTSPFQVSRNHCAIDEGPDNQSFVTDRGSTLGTLVNDTPIGSRAGILQTNVMEPINTLILGSSTSQIRFTLSFQRG